MKHYDMYGCKSNDIHSCKNYIEKSLSITFEERESSYFGIYYSASIEEHEYNFELKQNIDLIDEEFLEMNFRDFPILFYVNKVDEQLSLSIKNIIKQDDIFDLLLSESL